MSKPEVLFAQFLSEECILSRTQEEVDNCPFNKNGKYKTDFYLPEYDFHVEIKGILSLFSINVVLYVDRILHKNIYLLSMTNEDWMGRYETFGFSTKKKKIDVTVQKQFEEFRQLFRGERSASKLVGLSRKRIEEYIKLRNGDLEFWATRMKKL